jgi:protein TonB
MKIVALLVLVMLATPALCQDTTYYNTEGKKVETIHEADYCEMVVFPEGDSLTAHLQQFFTNGAKKSETTFTDFKKKKKEGIYRSWYKNGKQQREIEYNEGKMDGKVMTWWENGTVKRSAIYQNDSLVKGTCYDSSGKEVSYYDYLIMPEFPGGEAALLKYLSKETKYPAYARENNIQGKVFVSFFVDRNGNVLESKVVKSPSEHLSSEALRVVNHMPQWKPGMEDGEKTGVMYYLPLSFTMR